jgi:hyaluronan synthase
MNSNKDIVEPSPRAPVQPAGAERRVQPRTADPFAAAVQLGGIVPWRRVKAVVRDYDGSGACIIAAFAPEPGRKITVRFRLPKSLCGPFAGLPCRACGVVRSVREREEGGYEIVVSWDKPLPGLITEAAASHRRKIGAWVALALMVIVWLKWDNMKFFWYEPVFYTYSFTIGLYFLSRFALLRGYRPPEPLAGYEPTLSIVISVRNEEGAIGRTVETCFAADYPDEKREVIVVDDGSSDGTPAVLRELQARYSKLKVFTIPPTGKRGGMATGVKNASGELIVFVDSDTFIYNDALRRLVCGFEDPTVGASAGYTEVENPEKNALTGLQEVRYVLSYRLMKAAESIFDAVTCCPGCLSAYRRSYLLKILDLWLNQRFLGAPATFGDDRSLTNYILRDYRVIYNSTAMSSTLVPETWRRYLNQQVRWKKSWLRETLIAGTFMWRKHPAAALSFYTAAFCSLLSPLIVFRAGYLGFVDPDAFLSYYVLGLILVGFTQGLLYLALKPNSRWLLGMLLVASQVVVLGPQTYYALLTMRRNHWGSRSG